MNAQITMDTVSVQPHYTMLSLDCEFQPPFDLSAPGFFDWGDKCLCPGGQGEIARGIQDEAIRQASQRLRDMVCQTNEDFERRDALLQRDYDAAYRNRAWRGGC